MNIMRFSLLPWYFLFICRATIAREPYAFEGSLEISRLNSEKSQIEQFHRFRVEAGGQVWHIADLTHSPRAAYTFEDYVVDRFDSADGARQSCQVSPYSDGGYPKDLDGDQRLLWFVYCARDYLRGRNEQQLTLPSGDARVDIHVTSCKGRVRWRDDADICPASVDFLFDHGLVASTLKDLSLEPPGQFLDERKKALHILLKRYSDGTLLAEFEAKSWTNIGSVGVPRDWSLRLFTAGQIARVYSGRTEDVKQIEVVTVPQLPETCHITDKRLRDASRGLNFVYYTTTNGEIKELGSPPLKSLAIAQADPRRMTMPPRLRLQRFIFITILTTLVALPILKYLLDRRWDRT